MGTRRREISAFSRLVLLYVDKDTPFQDDQTRETVVICCPVPAVHRGLERRICKNSGGVDAPIKNCSSHVAAAVAPGKDVRRFKYRANGELVLALIGVRHS